MPKTIKIETAKMRKTITTLTFFILFLLFFSNVSSQSSWAVSQLEADSNSWYINTQVSSEMQENLSLSFKYIQVDNSMPPRVDHSDGPAYFFGFAMGDLTGDGYKEIVAHKMFYRNPGGDMEGTWERVNLPWDWTDAFAIVDVDSDSFGDVIAEGEEVDGDVNIYWLEMQDTIGASWSRVLIGTVPKTRHLWSQEYAVAQIFSEGRPEILIGGGDGVYCFKIPPNPMNDDWPRVKIIGNGYGYATGDIDGDGNLDVAGAYDDLNVAWWKNPGDESESWARFKIGRTVEDADRFAIADINRDGRNDIIVSEEVYPIQSRASIFWFDAKSDPQSEGWVRNTVLSDAWSLNSLSVADIDCDGDMSIVSGEMGNLRRLMFSENDGEGNFRNTILDTAKESHLGARVADLDSDGDLDIASIGWNEYQYVHVWRHIDALQVLPELKFDHVIIDTIDYANARSIDDINGDGFLDIIAAKKGLGLTWYEYPTWSKYSIESFNWYADDLHSADIDGDGDVDVVGMQDEDGKVYWFENPRPRGKSTDTWTSHYIGSNNGAVKDYEIADLNADGKLDVITRTSPTASVFLQESPTSWIKVKTIIFQSVIGNIANIDGLDVGDIDKDGDMDIALNGFWIETPSDLSRGVWAEHDIDPRRWNQNTGGWQDNNAKVHVADINKDGRLDVLISQSEKAGYPISWYEASDPKSGSWIEHIIGYVDYCHTLETGDMDNDGDIDVVAGKFERDDGAIPAPYPLYVFCNDGNGLSWEIKQIDSVGIYNGVIGDIGNDGDLDIVGSRSYWKGPIEIWENMNSDNRSQLYTQEISGKVYTPLSLSANSEAIYANSPVTFSGVICDSQENGLGNVLVSLYKARNESSKWSLIAEDLTDSMGNYDFIWNPSRIGKLTVKAEWKGNQTHRESSTTTNIEVLSNPTILSLTLNCSISNFGLTVSIHGSLISNGLGLPNIPILLSYSVTGGQIWNEISQPVTAFDGSYSTIWRPSATGEHIVKAVWTGNTTIQAATDSFDFAVVPFDTTNVFPVTSNSTISSLSFESENRELKFVVSGPEGTEGFVEVAIAKSLISDIEAVKVKLNNTEIDHATSSIDESWLLYFTYQHSSHTITLNLNAASPSVFNGSVIELVIVGTPLAIIYAIAVFLFFVRRKVKKT